jgi:hypothetical protein
MPQCITCGAELHPQRAEKYNYCMSAECQEKNLKGLTMVAVGVNKAAEQFLLLDEETKDELANGKYRDQRRGLFGPQAPAAGPRPAQPERRSADSRVTRARRKPSAAPAPRPRWTASQERLARLYNEQGLRPAEIASKLGVSEYLATQMVLAARSRPNS